MLATHCSYRTCVIVARLRLDLGEISQLLKTEYQTFLLKLPIYAKAFLAAPNAVVSSG